MGRFKVKVFAPPFRKLVSGMGWRLPGLLLLTAAILKILNRNQPATDELAWLSGYVGVHLGSLAPPIEMAMGNWMLFRRSDRVKGTVAAVIFTLFLALNLHRANQGIQECSCFGGLSVPVAVTIVIDLVGIACGLLRAGLVRNVLQSGFWRTCRTNASSQKHVGKHDLGENHPVWAAGMRESVVAIGLGMLLASGIRFGVLIAPLGMSQQGNYKPEDVLQVVQFGPTTVQMVNHE